MNKKVIGLRGMWLKLKTSRFAINDRLHKEDHIKEKMDTPDSKVG
ncbi:hypothetical protein [Thermoactinomyces mirandus]|nr:hypothetical protein [Thermoactinomyces mirandus]